MYDTSCIIYASSKKSKLLGFSSVKLIPSKYYLL